MSNMSKLILFFIYLFLKDKIISISSCNYKNDIPGNIYLINLFIKNNSNFFIFYDKKNKPKLEYKKYE